MEVMALPNLQYTVNHVYMFCLMTTNIVHKYIKYIYISVIIDTDMLEPFAAILCV
jgi:hypothetical protein